MQRLTWTLKGFYSGELDGSSFQLKGTVRAKRPSKSRMSFCLIGGDPRVGGLGQEAESVKDLDGGP